MNYQYTIAEKDSSLSKNKLPYVRLHDTPVRYVRYENGDFILSTEGFTVSPHCPPNNTDRYLQTGDSEIRIINTEIPDGYPMDAVDYDLLAHEYDSRKGIFRLSADLGGKQVWFRFRCSGVEYRFSEFAGDAWIQKCRDSDRKALKQHIAKGSGYAYDMLKRMSPPFREEYIDLLTDAACRDLRLDHQCDEIRAHYVTELISLLPDSGKNLIGHLMRNQWRNCVNPDINPDDFSHCVGMILENREHPLADETIAYLEKQLTEMLAGMKDNTTEEYWTERKLESLRWQVCEIIPESDKPAKSPRPATPDDTMDSIIEFCRTSEKSVHPARFRKFFEKNCTADDTAKLLQAARQETDPVLRQRLYSMFAKVDFPADPSELIAEARSAEPQLTGDYPEYIAAMNLQRAVSRLRHPAVIAYRDELLRKAESAEEERKYQLIGYAIDHWAANYFHSEEEYNAFSELLYSLPDDPDGLRHHAAFTITYSRMYDEHFEDPTAYSHLYWICMDTYCPNCRRKALEILRDHGKLNQRVMKICLHDCDSRIRQLAEQWLAEN